MTKRVLKIILEPIRLFIFQIKWRIANKHNFTNVEKTFPIDRVRVGKATYGTIIVYNTQNPNGSLDIGSYCSIANGVCFLLSGEHYYKYFSTYPFKAKICGQHMEAITKGPITVCDDVWIGRNSMILSGVTLGQGCIIGAGSIVAKNVPPYAIFAGGKIIKYRFSQEVIDKLLQIDFSKLDYNSVKNNIDLFYTEDFDEFFKSDLYTKILKINKLEEKEIE